MYDPNNPTPNDGQMHIMGALQGQARPPISPGGGMAPPGTGAPGGGGQHGSWDRAGFRDARQDWRQARPDFASFAGDPQAMMAALQGWRDDRPMRSAFGAPVRQAGAVAPGDPGQGFAPPGGLNPVPQAPGSVPGMVGSSYGVQGIVPGSGFELPTY